MERVLNFDFWSLGVGSSEIDDNTKICRLQCNKISQSSSQQFYSINEEIYAKYSVWVIQLKTKFV